MLVVLTNLLMAEFQMPHLLQVLLVLLAELQLPRLQLPQAPNEKAVAASSVSAFSCSEPQEAHAEAVHYG